MVKVRSILTSFNGGEVSARLSGRVDADIYDRALTEMFNFVPTIEGPAMKRPGARWIRAAAASSTWLTSFVFNTTQAYVLEWLEGALRFYTNGGQIEAAPDVPYELAVPYTAAEAPRVSQAQSYDRLYLAHGGHAPATLTRTGAEEFAYAALALRRGPFRDSNTNEAITVSTNGTIGNVTLTASAPIFKPGHVGAPFLLEAADFGSIPAWEVGISGVVAGSSKRRSDGRVYVAASSGRTGSVQPTHSQGTESDGMESGQDVGDKGPYGVKWTYLHDRHGMVQITGYISPTQVTATVTRRLADDLKTAGSWRWAHGAFSEAEGWPHLVCIWAGRLIFFKGVELFASVAGDLTNFAPLTDSGSFTPDMAFRRTLDAADPPLWVKADDQLLVGTASGELLIGQINMSAPLAGDNIKAPAQSSYGSAPVWPVDIGTGVVFVQRGGRKVREAAYEFERDRFVGLNLNVWSRHISRSGIRQLAFQQEPEQMLWGVRNDGILACHAHSPEQQTKGFARVAFANGEISILSAVSIPSDNGTLDDLWLLTELGGTKGVCKLGDWWEEDAELGEAEQLAKLKAAFYVDWGVSYSGAPKKEFNEGLDHLIGHEVRILADGGVCPPQVVQASNPKVTLPYAAGEVHIGLGYQARLTPLRPEIRGAPGGTVQGARKRIIRLVARLIDTAALLVRDPQRGKLERLIDRPGNSKMDAPVPLFTGDTENKATGGGYDRAGQPTIVSDDPLPCMVVCLMPTIESEDP